jgi:formimidoylglutamate deiminase
MPALTLYLPDILLAQSSGHSQALAQTGLGLLVDANGTVAGFASEESAPADVDLVLLRGKALLPGLANAHSHTFQRLFRGRAEGRDAGGDTFWTWREQMYRAAAFLSPEDVYDVARATFLEMLCAGITVVGEFHYLHRDRQGNSYQDPNLLAKQIIAAAQSVGIGICLLRTAYFRAGFKRPPHPGQARFYESPAEYLRNVETLVHDYSAIENVAIGVAPHSIRAVPLNDLQQIAEFAKRQRLPMHMHISEQIGENTACHAEYGTTPVQLLHSRGLLSSQTTLIHAIHLIPSEFEQVADVGATICSCPTTERNLGDGIFPADTAFRLGIPVAFGTDSQAQIDILEDARQLEYHVRLRDQQRGVLDGSARESWASTRAIETSLFGAATANGYAALGLDGGTLAVGKPADFFTVDLEDLSILGADAESLESQAVFALSKSAVCDVAVQGRLVVRDGRHAHDEDIRRQYLEVQRRFREH